MSFIGKVSKRCSLNSLHKFSHSSSSVGSSKGQGVTCWPLPSHTWPQLRMESRPTSSAVVSACSISKAEIFGLTRFAFSLLKQYTTSCLPLDGSPQLQNRWGQGHLITLVQLHSRPSQDLPDLWKASSNIFAHRLAKSCLGASGLPCGGETSSESSLCPSSHPPHPADFRSPVHLRGRHFCLLQGLHCLHCHAWTPLMTELDLLTEKVGPAGTMGKTFQFSPPMARRTHDEVGCPMSWGWTGAREEVQSCRPGFHGGLAAGR